MCLVQYQQFSVSLHMISLNSTMIAKRIRLVVPVLLVFCASISAQSVSEELKSDVNRAAGICYAIPATVRTAETPPPDGKLPFYINHFGCPAPFYLEHSDKYEKPYSTLAKANRRGKLTALGCDVLHRIDLLRNDASNRTNEVTKEGVAQIREQMRQLISRYPEVFSDNCYIDGRSIVQNHCIQTTSEALVELARYCNTENIGIKTTHKDMNWLNPQDKSLTSSRTDSLAMAGYADIEARNANDARLIQSLFSDAEYARDQVDSTTLSRQIFELAGSIQHTALSDSISLYDLFTPEEIQSHWRRKNAWNYINYGNCPLNGGHQAYLQRAPLWNLLHVSDSIMKLDFPVVHLRYTNNDVIMSLASLMELDDCGLMTTQLDSLEALGWVDYRIAPFCGRIEMIHYRRDMNDDDPLIKVLLNGHEATLPIKTDCPPYYHWNDVKHYYLRKLYRYEKARQDANEKNKQKEGKE